MKPPTSVYLFAMSHQDRAADWAVIDALITNAAIDRARVEGFNPSTVHRLNWLPAVRARWGWAEGDHLNVPPSDRGWFAAISFNQFPE